MARPSLVSSWNFWEIIGPTQTLFTRNASQLSLGDKLVQTILMVSPSWNILIVVRMWFADLQCTSGALDAHKTALYETVSACKSLHVWRIPTIKFAGDIKKGHRGTLLFFAPQCNFHHKNGLMRWKMWKNPSLSKGRVHLNTSWPLSPHSQGKTLMQWQPQLVMKFSYWEVWLIFFTNPELLALPCTISIIYLPKA